MRAKRSEFGRMLSTMLAASDLNQGDLALRLETSDAYLSALVTGRKKVSPRWADLIATALQATDVERRDLHLAAARDMGFRL